MFPTSPSRGIMYLNRSGHHLDEGHENEYKIHKFRRALSALLSFSALEPNQDQAAPRRPHAICTSRLSGLQVQVRAEGLRQIQDHAPVRHNGHPLSLSLVQGREAEAAGRFVDSRVNLFSGRADRMLHNCVLYFQAIHLPAEPR